MDIIRDERKCIVERRIYTRESLNYINQKISENPMDKNVHTPTDKNVLDSNIYINNIAHNKELSEKNEYMERVFFKKE